MPQAKVIKFVKWVDPFKAAKKEEGDEFEAARDTFEERQHSPYSGPMLLGPGGAMPLHESCFPGELYNLWMLHIDVNLSRKVKQAIVKVPGVEVFNEFTCYRAQIGIGECFDEDEVKEDIRAAILAVTKSPVQRLIDAARGHD